MKSYIIKRGVKMIVIPYHFFSLICRLLFLVGHNRAASRHAFGTYVAKPSTLVTPNWNKNINEKITDKHNVVAVQIRGKGSFSEKCPLNLTSLSRAGKNTKSQLKVLPQVSIIWPHLRLKR